LRRQRPIEKFARPVPSRAASYTNPVSSAQRADRSKPLPSPFNGHIIVIGGFLEFISGQWDGWWIYWIGPLAGMLLAVLACSFLAKRIEVAKLYYFDADHDRLFRRMARPRLPTGTNT